MSNMTSFFDELVEAKRAVEALPTVQAALAKAESEKQFLNEKLYDHGVALDQHKATIEDLKTTISKLEASLDAANKSKGDVDDKLRLLTSILHSVAADASEAVALVEPKPEPKPASHEELMVAVETPQPAVSVQSDPTEAPMTSSSMASVVDPLPSGSSSPVEAGRSADPFLTSATTNTMSGQSAPTTGEGISQASEVPSSGPFSSTDGAGAIEQLPNSGSPEVSSNSGPAPFASSTGDTQATVASGGIQEGSSSGASHSAAASSPKPHQDKPWWQKPQGMSWTQWQDLGGKVTA